jgi:hypothetical protein
MFKNARIKSIKFVEKTTYEQLRRELEMINNNMDFIVKHNGKLDLMLTISLTGPQPTTETLPTNRLPIIHKNLPNVLLNSIQKIANSYYKITQLIDQPYIISQNISNPIKVH